ncbi:hypothetical protein SKAU_G00305330 [Synaphobranchus kaupii]|uniref:Uncharacterized protein n=1 Tax=Synaphobranchus kaupii TaxID=118154 RepID=A0A9Q1EQH7_SYNKA|nr:hypothetical protein SKAU_G00305330 [Synaphobranchus kaupii]
MEWKPNTPQCAFTVFIPLCGSFEERAQQGLQLPGNGTLVYSLKHIGAAKARAKKARKSLSRLPLNLRRRYEKSDCASRLHLCWHLLRAPRWPHTGPGSGRLTLCAESTPWQRPH